MYAGSYVAHSNKLLCITFKHRTTGSVAFWNSHLMCKVKVIENLENHSQFIKLLTSLLLFIIIVTYIILYDHAQAVMGAGPECYNEYTAFQLFEEYLEVH